MTVWIGFAWQVRFKPRPGFEFELCFARVSACQQPKAQAQAFASHLMLSRASGRLPCAVLCPPRFEVKQASFVLR